MQIIPVLDLLGSQVVRGVAGRRDQYRPLVTRLVEGSDPVTIATAIRGAFGLRQLYVADLDAILYRRLNTSLLRALCTDRFSLMVDAGLRSADEAAAVFDAGVDQIVAGLETLESPNDLRQLIRQHGSARIVFSLDLRNGESLASSPAWALGDPLEIARCAVESGCTQLIVLDIARVGTAGGVATLPLCEEIRRAFPGVTIVTGGGVRSVDDLRTLERAGIDGVLVASALHDGSITSLGLAEFGKPLTGGT